MKVFCGEQVPDPTVDPHPPFLWEREVCDRCGCFCLAIGEPGDTTRLLSMAVAAMMSGHKQQCREAGDVR